MLVIAMILAVSWFSGCSRESPNACLQECIHGRCVDGVCVCDEGWFGSACEKKLAPYSSLIIDSVRVYKYPSVKPSGRYWDEPPLWDGDFSPEVFLRIIVYSTEEVVWESLTEEGNADTLVLIPKPNLYISRELASSEYVIFRLLDEDQGDPPDEMCVSRYYRFYPDLTGEGTVRLVEVQCGDSTVLELFVRYVW